MTLAEKLHQRAAELRKNALQARSLASTWPHGSAQRLALLRHATLVMREAGTTLRRARRIARSVQHGGAVT